MDEQQTGEAGEEMAIDPIALSAERALAGFMTRSPEDIGLGRRRCWFLASLLPAVKQRHCCWDGGDCTSRALDAWFFLRSITGDWNTGKDVEEGQFGYLLSLLEPGTDLPLMPDESPGATLHQTTEKIHMWDAGRVLRFYVNRWIYQKDDDCRSRAESAISALRRMGIEETIAENRVLWFASDQYSKGKPCAIERKDLWVVRSGQILEPVARMALATGNRSLLDLCMHLYFGALSGREPRVDIRTDRQLLGPDGSFFGHFHSVSSTLTGMTVLARCLLELGRTEEALRIVEKVERTYHWIYSQKENHNGASSFGWFPENTGNSSDIRHTRVFNETCCTADMIELGCELASLADVDSSLAHLHSMWDDVDRSIRNTLLQAQWNGVESDIDRLSDAHPKTYESGKIRSIAWEMQGTWHDVFYPNDFATYMEEPSAFMSSLGVRIGMSCVGCCAYSGPRGLFSAWKHCVTEDHDRISINLHFSRATESVHVDVSKRGGWMDVAIEVQQPGKNLRVFRPPWVERQKEKISLNGRSMLAAASTDSTWWSFRNLNMRDTVVIRYPLVHRTTKELLAPPIGHSYVTPEKRISYKAEWEGNTVISVDPQGVYFPFPGGSY